MKTTAVLTSFVVVALAQGPNTASTGPFLPVGLASTPEARDAAESAGRNPNATGSVGFPLSYNNKDEQWDWRVNITELKVPNDHNQFGNQSTDYSQDLRAANTQWELQWPGDGDQTLQALAEKRNMSIYFNAFQVYLPSNVTDKYMESNGSQCANVLGEQCAGSFMQAVRQAGLAAIDTTDLQGCESTFDVSLSSGRLGFDLTNSSDLHPGDTLWYYTSPTWPASNLTTLNQTEGSLQMLTMNVQYGSQSTEKSDGDESVAMLCLIAKANAGKSGNSTQTMGSGAVRGKENSKLALLSTLVLGALIAF